MKIKHLSVIGMMMFGGIGSAYAQVPVTDATNLVQTTAAAIEDAAQTAKQILQYELQLEQYQNMLQNTLTPVTQIWDQVQQTMSGLNTAINTLEGYKKQLGSVDTYLGQFKDSTAYSSSPCFTSAGCGQTDLKSLQASIKFGSTAQKTANDSLFKGLEQQMSALQADATQLNKLQSGAGNAPILVT